MYGNDVIVYWCVDVVVVCLCVVVFCFGVGGVDGGVFDVIQYEVVCSWGEGVVYCVVCVIQCECEVIVVLRYKCSLCGIVVLGQFLLLCIECMYVYVDGFIVECEVVQCWVCVVVGLVVQFCGIVVCGVLV